MSTMKRFEKMMIALGIMQAMTNICGTDTARAQELTFLKGYDRHNLDLNAVPGDDFVQYATGGWLSSHPLRADQMMNGAFVDLSEQNQKQIQELILQFSTTKQQEGTLGQKIGSLYNLRMDSTRMNAEGYKPIVPVLEKIKAVKSVKEYQLLTAQLDRRGESTMMFNCGVGADQKQSDRNIVGFSQGGLGLGDRDYYFNEDEQTKKVMAAYKEMYRKLFVLVGYDEQTAAGKVDALLAIEKRIAEKSYSNVQLRDVEGNYHKMSYAELVKDFPGIDWAAIMPALGFPAIDSVDVGQPEPLHEVEKILGETSLEDLKSYAEARILGGAINALSDEFHQVGFDFQRTVTGREEDEPRWKYATNLVNGVMGNAIGQMYCEKYFPESSKQKMEEMVRNLQVSLSERIAAAEWMTEPTKRAAIKKLACFTVKIGYPDKWRDYSRLKVDESLSLYENLANISEFFWLDNIERKVNKPVDKSEWHMNPQTINAYYSPSSNEICFPAGILQPPFFDPEADDAINYGAIGAVIGHEMSHGFDDQGCQFDLKGNQNNWWTAEDKAAFDKRTSVLEEYFSTLEVINGKTVNGQLTLGENIGDNGGINIALQAYHNTHPDAPVIDGFTADQRFFLAWARMWGSNIRPEVMDMLLTRDVHSPNRFRVNGALPHIDAWYKAFGVTKDNKLYVPKSKRARVW